MDLFWTAFFQNRSYETTELSLKFAWASEMMKKQFKPDSMIHIWIVVTHWLHDSTPSHEGSNTFVCICSINAISVHHLMTNTWEMCFFRFLSSARCFVNSARELESESTQPRDWGWPPSPRRCTSAAHTHPRSLPQTLWEHTRYRHETFTFQVPHCSLPILVYHTHFSTVVYFLAKPTRYTSGSHLRTVMSCSHGSSLAAEEHLSTISCTISVLSFFTNKHKHIYICTF